MKSNRWKFDPHQSLVELGIFQWSVGIIFTISVIVFVTITYNSGLTTRWDFIGFNKAIEIFKVPISILALIIPMVALIASNHRSEQSREQMRLTSSQNNFANHFKHLEEFEKYNKSNLNRMQIEAGITPDAIDAKLQLEVPYVKPIYYRELYKKIYPNSSEGDLEISTKFVDKKNTFLNSMINFYNQFEKPDFEAKNIAAKSIEIGVEEFLKDTFLFVQERNRFSHIDLSIENHDHRYYVSSIILKEIQSITIAIDQILRFDVKYSASELDLKIINMDPRKSANIDVNRGLGNDAITPRQRMNNIRKHQ